VHQRLAGCFPRAAGDADDAQAFHDPTCVSATSRNSSLEPCRSGMPFFRLALQPEQSYLDCFTFCLSKGLDLAGVMHSELAGASECRCGATEANKAAWHGMAPPPGLLLPICSPLPQGSELCKMAVWQYTGPLEYDGVPTVFMELSLSDQAYIDGIAVGVDPSQIDEEEPPEEEEWEQYDVPEVDPAAQGNQSLLSTGGLCEDHADTGATNKATGKLYSCPELTNWCKGDNKLGRFIRVACPYSCGICNRKKDWMSCYPHACGTGTGPWLTKASDNLVHINYFFENLDAGRKAAFEKAKLEWESKTCVRFTYSTATPRIRVTVVNEKTCSAHEGYPGSDGTRDVNLGWCNQVNHWGNVAHELGHALGMSHEQKRPDATASVYTPAGIKGPYLKVKWSNVEQKYVPQWKSDRRSYIGSKTGKYAEYDYGSLLHYGLGDSAVATNPAFQLVPGQREGLTAGDVLKFEDLYQCRTSPAQQTQQAATSTSCRDTQGTVPNGGHRFTCAQWACAKWCDASPTLRAACPGSCAEANKVVQGYTCMQWHGFGYCDASNTLKAECPHLCGQCG
jgi:hypothetical protein